MIEQRSDLDVLAEVLWPGAELRLGAMPSASLEHANGASSADRVESYVAVPSLGQPRYLMPADVSGRAAQRLLTEYNSLRATPQRIARALLAASARLGHVPGRRQQRLTVSYADVDGADGALLGLAAETLGLPVAQLRFSCGVRVVDGVARPVVTVADQEGTPLLFVKIARRELHRRRMQTEHDMLSLMTRRPRPGVHTPEPLLLTEWAGGLVLGTRPLPQDVRPLRPRHAKLAQQALTHLVPVAQDLVEVADSGWFASLAERAGRLGGTPADDFLRAHGELAHRWAGLRLPHGLGHGDWSFWNLATSRSSAAVAVWDWEFGHPSAPIGLDQLHWHFAIDATRRAQPLDQVVGQVRRRLPATQEASALHELHLLEMALRRLEDATLGQTRAAAGARVLLDILTR